MRFQKIFFLALSFFSFFTFNSFSATVTSIASGDWSSFGTWGGPTPTTMDDVVINPAHTVTLSTSSNCASLQVNGGLDMGANSMSVYGSVTGAGNISMTSGAFNIKGDYSNTGSFTPGTGLVSYSGFANQIVKGGAGVSYYILQIMGSGIKTLSGDVTVNNNFDFQAGNFNLGTAVNFTVMGSVNLSGILVFGNTVAQTVIFTGNVTRVGGGLDMTGGSFPHQLHLRGATNDVPPVSCNSGVGSKIIYDGLGPQTVAPMNYCGLAIQTTAANLVGNIGTGEALTIASGANLNALNYNVDLYDNFSNTGTFNGGTGNANILGGTQSISGTGLYNFNNLNINNFGSADLGANIKVLGSLNIVAGGLLNANSYFIDVNQDFINNGTFNPGTGIVNFVGGAVGQTLGGASTVMPLNILSINKTSGTISLARDVDINSNLNILAGTFNAANYNININGDWLNNGNYVPGTGTVQFVGPASQQIMGTAPAVNFYSLDINKTALGDLVFTTIPLAVSGSTNIILGTLDLGLIPTHNLGAVSGTANNSTIAISGPISGNSVFPAGNFTNFLAPGGGGAVLYNSSNNYTINQAAFPAGMQYNLVKIMGGGIKTLSSNMDVKDLLFIDPGTTLDQTGGVIDVTNQLINDGVLNVQGYVKVHGPFINNTAGQVNNMSIGTIEMIGDLQNNGSSFNSAPGSFTIFSGIFNQYITGNQLQFDNVTISKNSGTFIAHNANVIVNNVLNFSGDGKIVLNGYDLILGPAATIPANTFGPYRMIETSGIPGGPGNLVKNAVTSAQMQGFYPIGTAGLYTPLNIIGGAFSFAGTGSLLMKSLDYPTYYPSSDYANRFISLGSINVSSVSDFQFIFQYGSSPSDYTNNPTTIARYTAGTPNSVVGGFNNLGSETYGVNATGNNFIDGNWVLSINPPVISGFNPTNGCPGDSIDIQGSFFTSANSVKFNGITAGYSIKSDILIRAKVPVGSATGLISVDNPDGSTNSSSNFTVNSPPATPGTIVGSVNYCNGGTGSYNVPLVAGITYTWSLTGGGTITSGQNTDVINVSYSTSPTQVCVTAINGCGTSSPSCLAISGSTPPGAPSTSDDNICSGNTGTVTASGTSISWYDAATGGTFLGSGPSYTSPMLGSTTSYYAEDVIGTCVSATRGMATVNVNPVPAAPSTSDDNICSGNTGTVTASGTSISWYDAATGGTLLGGGPSYTSPILGSTTSYYAEDVIGTCVSATRGMATVNVNPTPAATIGTANVSCFGSNDGAINIISPTGGSGVYEFSVNNGSTWQTSANFGGLIAGSYDVMIRDQLSPSCFSPLGTVTLTEPASIGATVGTANVSCFGSNDGVINIISPTGGSGVYEFSVNNGSSWQTSVNFGGLIAGSYGVMIRDQLSPSCFSPLGTVILTQPASISATLSVPTSATICNGSTTDFTVTSSGTGPFSFDLSNGTDVFNFTGQGSSSTVTVSPTITGGWSVINLSDASCSASGSFGLESVTVNTAPSAPSTANDNICSGNAGTVTASGTSISWYDAATGGTFLGSGPSYTSPILISTTSYYAEDVIGTCVSATRGMATVNVNPAPVAPSTTDDNICSGNTGTVTASGTNISWYDSPTGGTFLGNGFSYTSPVLGSTISYYAEDMIGTCMSATRGMATVNVNPAPVTSAIAGSSAVCANTLASSYSVTLNAGSTYVWTITGGTQSSGGITNSITADWGASGAGNVSVTETNAGCTGIAVNLPVTINVAPVTSAITGSSTVCANTLASPYSVTLNAGSTYAWTIAGGIQSSGANTSSIAVDWGVSGAGDISVVETNSGCQGAVVNLSITKNNVNPPSITASGLTLCSGTNVILSIPSFPIIQWYLNGSKIVGETNTNYQVVTPGDYKVYVSDNFCNAISNSISIGNTSEPIVNVTGNTLTTSASSADYQWYVNSPSGSRAIYGATSTTYNALYNADYFVAIHSNNCRVVSLQKTINNGGLTPLLKQSYQMNDSTIVILPPGEEVAEVSTYPNPSEGEFSVDYQTSSSGFVIIELYNSRGNRVLSKEVEIESGRATSIFKDLNVKSGIYMIYIIDGDKKVAKNIQIN